MRAEGHIIGVEKPPDMQKKGVMFCANGVQNEAKDGQNETKSRPKLGESLAKGL